MNITRYKHVLLLTIGALVFSERSYGYDQFAYLTSVPSGPFSPRSSAECQTYADKAMAVVQQVEAAHDGCLASESNEGFAIPRDSSNRCDKPKCQTLHDARLELRKTATKRISECQVAVDKHAAAESERATRAKEERLRSAQRNPCEREWLQYEAVCTGDKWDSEAQKRSCTKELDRLRRSCRK